MNSLGSSINSLRFIFLFGWFETVIKNIVARELSFIFLFGWFETFDIASKILEGEAVYIPLWLIRNRKSFQDLTLQNTILFISLFGWFETMNVIRFVDQLRFISLFGWFETTQIYTLWSCLKLCLYPSLVDSKPPDYCQRRNHEGRVYIPLWLIRNVREYVGIHTGSWVYIPLWLIRNM